MITKSGSERIRIVFPNRSRENILPKQFQYHQLSVRQIRESYAQFNLLRTSTEYTKELMLKDVFVKMTSQLYQTPNHHQLVHMNTPTKVPYAGNIRRSKILVNTHFLNFWIVKYWQTDLQAIWMVKLRHLEGKKWRIATNSPNLPIFSPLNISRIRYDTTLHDINTDLFI